MSRVKQRKSAVKRSIVVEEFKEEVRKALKLQQVSLSELARRSGLSRFFIQRVLSRNECCPTLGSAEKIAAALGLKINIGPAKKK